MITHRLTYSQHRSLQPTGPPAQGQSQPHSHARLNEAFDNIRAEFDSALTEANVVRNQKDEIEGKGPSYSSNFFFFRKKKKKKSRINEPLCVVVQQVNELNIIRQSLYDLEAQHNKVRQQFEDELGRLRSELMTTRQQLAAATSGAGGPPPAGSGISAGPGAPSQIGPGGALVGGPPYPPAGEPPYGRDYARERPIEREPRIGDRPGLGPLTDRGLSLADRERDRDRMDRERERERDRERDRLERDRDRVPDARDPKRMKNDRIKSDRPG
jgi:glucose repression regulatory protein TUP1